MPSVTVKPLMLTFEPGKTARTSVWCPPETASSSAPGPKIVSVPEGLSILSGPRLRAIVCLYRVGAKRMMLFPVAWSA
jgi:hypothetical protein